MVWHEYFHCSGNYYVGKWIQPGQEFVDFRIFCIPCIVVFQVQYSDQSKFLFYFLKTGITSESHSSEANLAVVNGSSQGVFHGYFYYSPLSLLFIFVVQIGIALLRVTHLGQKIGSKDQGIQFLGHWDFSDILQKLKEVQ